MSKYETTFFSYFENLKRSIRAMPLNLGGIVATTSGMVGGPPGGFVGYLPQSRVAYDTMELALSGFMSPSPYNPSGYLISASLLDNLNHIRYRIAVVEALAFGGGTLRIDEDGSLVASGITVLNFTGPSVDADSTGPGEVTITISGGADEKAKVSSNDTTTNYLENKLIAGSNITIAVNNEGANEQLQISATVSGIPGNDEKVKISSNDTTADYLFGKLTIVSPLTLTEVNDGSDEHIAIGYGTNGIFQAKVSNNDTVYNYLENKIVAGTNVTVTVLDEGGSEQLQISASGGGGGSFLSLTDTPSSYAGQAGKYTRVNTGETALEFVTISGGGGSPIAIKDEGVTVTSEVSSIDFVGPSVVATVSGTAVTVTISGTGGALEAAFVGAKVYKTTNQQLTTSTAWQDISWGAADYESDGDMWTGGITIIIQEAGYYSIVGQVTISGALPQTERLQVGLFDVNTFKVGLYDGYYVTTSGNRTLQVLYQGYLAVNASMNMKVLNGAGTQPYVLSGIANTFLNVHKIHGAVQAQEADPKIVSVYLTGYISPANETETAITWNAEKYDTDSMWSSGSQIQINTAGYYHVDACALWEDLNAHGNVPFQIKVGVRLNGTTMIAQKWEWHDVDTDGDRTEGLSTPISCDTPYLDTDDYLEIVVWHSKGSTASNIIRANDYNTYCMIHKIQ